MESIKPMRITWVSFARIEPTLGGGLTSNIASARYRILLPLQYLGKAGFQIQLLMITANEANAQAFAAMQADVVVFSKSFHPINETLAQEAKKHGACVIFDICDNHFDNPQLGDHYKRMAALADLVVCNTEAMAEVTRAQVSTPCRVIEDPVEGPPGAPRFAPQGALKLLWFGHPLNLDSLAAAMPDLAAAAQPVALSVMTQLAPDVQQWLKQDFGKNLKVTGLPWSLEGQWRALREADAIIIPSLSNARKNVKSANRLLEGMRAGRMVIANPVPSYAAFAKWAWIGAPLSEGLRWLTAHEAEIPGRIAAAQTYIESHYAAPAIAAKWQALLQEKP